MWTKEAQGDVLDTARRKNRTTFSILFSDVYWLFQRPFQDEARTNNPGAVSDISSPSQEATAAGQCPPFFFSASWSKRLQTSRTDSVVQATYGKKNQKNQFSLMKPGLALDKHKTDKTQKPES